MTLPDQIESALTRLNETRTDALKRIILEDVLNKARVEGRYQGMTEAAGICKIEQDSENDSWNECGVYTEKEILKARDSKATI